MTTVLVVDDDAMVRESTQTFLETQGFDVLSACDGQDALNKAENNRADIALVDIFMPNLDGFQTIKSICADIPVIAMSGVSSDQVEPLNIAKELGAKLTLSKPFLPKDLLDAIDAILNDTSDFH